MKKLNQGFTLLEMLIVIGIIAILITITAISYSTAQKKSRDSRRKGDLKMVQNAMEQYYSICGYVYPVSGTNLVPTIGCSSSGVVLMPTAAADPASTTPYPMTTTALDQYKICATLESESPGVFCIQNQQ